MVQDNYKPIPFRHLFVVFALLAQCHICEAAAKAKPLSDRVKIVWRTEDGLPQNGVKKVLQTRDGYIWVGTQEGLARFDGVHFTVFTMQNSAGLESDYIHDLAEDGEGSLWILANSGLARYKDGSIKDFTPTQEQDEDRVDKIWIGRDRHLYVACDDRFYRYADGKLNLLFSSKDRMKNGYLGFCDAPDGSVWVLGPGNTVYQFVAGGGTDYSREIPAGASITSIGVDVEGRVWLGGSALFVSQNGQFVKFPHQEIFHGAAIDDLCLDGAGDLWCLSGNSVYRLNGANWTLMKTVPDMAGRPRQFAVDASGAVCLVVPGRRYDTLYRYNDGAFSDCRVEEKIAVESALPVLQDREGDVWIGTEAGLECLKDPNCRTYTQDEGLPKSAVSVVYEDKSARVWVGTDADGLGYLNNGKFVPCPAKELDSGPIISICEDHTGTLWVSTNKVLYKYRDGVAVSYMQVAGTEGTIVRNAMCEDSHGNFWFGQGSDLFRISDGHMTHYGTKEGFNSDTVVLAMTADRKGGVWIGTLKGCSYFDGRGFTRYDAKDGLPTVPIIAILEDHEGIVWFGSWGGGLYRFKDGKISGITTKDGLYAASIHQVLEDDQDNLWIGSAKGIFRVPRKQLNNYLDGTSKIINCDPYGSNDGAAGGQCHGGTQPSGWRAKDGTLWFAGLNGLVRVEPRKPSPWRVPVLIEQASIDGVPFDPMEKAKVKPGRGDLEFHFTALGYVTPQKIQFQYELEGFDKGWVDAGTRRDAFYTNVPPGSYRFLVTARNGDGVLNPNQPAFVFTIEPHFYQTGWFIALCSVLVLVLGFGVYHVRVRQLEARRHELESKVDERTEDLQDANEELQAMQGELMNQNDELQKIQAEVEAQNEELITIKATLEIQNQSLAVANDRLEGLATVNGLTGLKNHRAFQEHFEQQWAYAHRYHSDLSIILMDVDSFKQYNDTYGHPAGDEVLKTVGKILMDTARDIDFVARYGGEEFVVILPKTDAAGATVVAERFRYAIQAAGWTARAVTASFGVATMTPLTDSRVALIAQADEALYNSKKTGRNKVSHIDDLTHPLPVT